MSQILLVKLKNGSWSYGQALARSSHCRLDPSSCEHGAVVDEQGTLHYFHIDVASRTTTELLSFQLRFRASSDAPLEPISKPWMFEFVPGLPGELMLVQPGSARVLYASLPRQDMDASDVFLFGTHTAPVTCINNNGNIALSGCDAGVLKLWRMADGQLADSVPLYDDAPAAVIAISCLGPLLVAAGNSAGAVTLYDIASGRLLAVQRLQAGEGPISCLTSWLDTELLKDAVLAAPGPRIPDGGGVLPGPDVGIPWRKKQQQQSDLQGTTMHPPAALLACCSSSGWLRVYQASQPGPLSWELLHSSHGLLASPITALKFSPRGDTLAIAGPAAQVLGTEAVAAAAAGGQPGAVSLYRVSSCAAEQKELQLWQQWCLRSVPVELLMLPSSHVEYLHDKQLQPTQVLHMLVTPEVGASLVLTATQSLDSSSVQPQEQQQLGLGQTPTAQADATQQQAAVSAADDIHRLDIAERDWSAVADAIQGARPLQESDLVAMLEDLIAETGDLLGSTDLESQTQQRLQQRLKQAQAASASATVDHQQNPQAPGTKAAGAHKQLFAGSSPASRHCEDPLHRASLQASGVFDQGLTVVDQGPAILEQGPVTPEEASSMSDQLGGQNFQHLQQQHIEQHNRTAEADAAPAVGATDDKEGMFGAQQTFTASSGLRDILSAAAPDEQATGDDVWAAAELPGHIFAASTARMNTPAASSSMQQPAAEDIDGLLFKRPNTLPTLRSWMDKAAALAAGVAAEGPTAVLDVEAIASEMRQQQESLLRQREQQQQVQQQMQIVSAAVADPVQQQPAQQQQQHLDAEDEELPGESTFQDLLLQQQQWQQRGRAAAATAAAAAQASTPEPVTVQQVLEPATVHHAAAPGCSGDVPGHPSSLGRVAEATSGAATAAVAAAAAGGDTGNVEEPQPRALPAALQKQRPQTTGPRPAGMRPTQQQQRQQKQQFVDAAEAAATGTTVLHQQAGRPPAAHIPAAVRRTFPHDIAVADAAAAGAPAATEEQQMAAHMMQGKLQQQQQQEQKQQEQQLVSAAASTAAAAAGVVLPVNDHPLATAVANSSRLLAKKVQEAEEAPQMSVDPADIVKLAVQLTNLDVDPEQQQYQHLADVRDIPTPTKAPKLVPKQLDARWLASRHLKPQMETLFKPEHWQPANIQPQVLVLPQWPTPQQVVQRLLWPQSWHNTQ